MPLYVFACDTCGKSIEMLLPMEHTLPACCGLPMRQVYAGKVKINIKYPMWVDRIEDIHKAQEQRGERLKFVHPKDIL